MECFGALVSGMEQRRHFCVNRERDAVKNSQGHVASRWVLADEGGSVPSSTDRPSSMNGRPEGPLFCCLVTTWRSKLLYEMQLNRAAGDDHVGGIDDADRTRRRSVPLTGVVDGKK